MRAMGLLFALLQAFLGCSWVHSFSIAQPRTTRLTQTFKTATTRQSNISSLFMAAGKGFGEPARKKASASSESKAESTAAAAASSASISTVDGTLATQETMSTTSSAEERMNAGQIALERMRRQKAEEEEAQLRSVRDLLLQDKLAKETPAVIPEKVAQRMGRRMLPFVGLPLFAAMGTFVGFWYFATYKNVEFQPAAVATTTVFLLFVGLLGITYSLLSASWDPDREGDFLGVDEFKTNVDNIRAGLSRSRENTLLREKMAGLSEGEIKAALSELERKEKAEMKRKQSLASKLKDELE